MIKQELFESIWKLSESLKGGNDPWDFKEYILCCLFYRYISEKIVRYINEGENESGGSFDYILISDDEAESVRDDIVNEIGYFILPSVLFHNVVKNADTNENLNTTVVNAFKCIEESSKGYDDVPDCFDGLFSGFDIIGRALGDTVKEKNQKIRDILVGIKNADFDQFIVGCPTIYGECFTYLIRRYASSIKNNPGDYFTPETLAILIGKLATVNSTVVQKVYDGSCGSGSLLLEVAADVGMDNIHIGLFGQDWDKTFYKLFRMNMLMHDIPYNKFDVQCGDTLTKPKHDEDTPFDIVVSNPKFSEKWVGEDDATLINDRRFSDAGILAPKANADMAFILHGLSYLSESGTAVFACHPGILYRDHAEQKIREYLVKNNRIDAIIQLAGKFAKNSIGIALMILRKAKKDSGILFVNASDQFEKSGNVNILSPENINYIVEIYKGRKEIPGVSRTVPYEELSDEKNSFNLSVTSYIDEIKQVEQVDIRKLNEEVRALALVNNSLREKIELLIKEIDVNE